MTRITDAFLSELKYRCNITDVVGRYVNLKRAGRLLKGLCPFHSEKTPSFVVYEDTQNFYCFGCAAGGDAITFIRRVENLDYLEAVRFLAEQVGMEMPEDEGDHEAARIRTRLLEINRELARYYYSHLVGEGGRPALEYFNQRQLSAATIKHFGLGYAPNNGFETVKHLKSLGYRDEELLLAGLKKSQRGTVYDPFRGRAMFPIIDLRGSVIAFGGRKIDPEDGGPKYLNSSDTMVFKKSRGLFAMNIAKDKCDGKLILAEGYMDVIAMHQGGFENAVATLGTALTDEQARVMARYAKEVIISYDSDGAGQKATMRAIEIFKPLDVSVKVLSIPGAKDPDEYIKTFGADEFRLLLSGSGSQVDYRIGKIEEKFDMTTPDGRLGFLGEFVELLADIPSLVEREVYAEKVALRLNISRASILTDAEKAAKRKKHAAEKKVMSAVTTDISAFNDKINPEKRKYLKAASAEEALISAIISAPELLDKLEAEISPENFVTGFNKRLYAAVISSMHLYGTFDLGMIGGDFSAEEMGRITRFMQTATTRKAADISEIRQYTDVIRAEKAAADRSDVSQLSANDINDILSDIAKRKNGKG